MQPRHATFALLAATAIGVIGPTPGHAVPNKGEAAVPGKPVAAKSTNSASSDACVLSGTSKLAANVVIYDQPTGGRPLARFTGGPVPVRVGPFAAEQTARVPVATGTGSGSFRFEGYVDAASVPVVATKDLPVVPNRVWIAGAQEVVVVGSKPGQLQVKKDLSRPLTSSFTTWVACDQVSMTRSSPKPWSAPGDTRGRLVGADPVALFASSKADQPPIAALSGARGLLVWSREKQGDFVHLMYHGEIVFNAWGRATDFPALPPGEITDRLAPATTLSTSPALKFEGSPRVIKTKAEVTIFNNASAKATAVGKIEAGTDTYVLDVIAGWVDVLPKSLNVAPPGEGRFWVKAADLGV